MGCGQLLACAAVLQPVPISYHFEVVKAPLSRIVGGTITSELPLPFLPFSQMTWAQSFDSNGHFPGGPGLADTRMSPFWILLELRMMEVVVTTGAIKCA